MWNFIIQRLKCIYANTPLNKYLAVVKTLLEYNIHVTQFIEAANAVIVRSHI